MLFSNYCSNVIIDNDEYEVTTMVRRCNMLKASQRHYKKAYRSNYQAYDALKHDDKSYYPRMLLLNYSIESGLKYLLMKKYGIDNPQRIFENDYYKSLFISHHCKKMLKELNKAELWTLTEFNTDNVEVVTSSNCHEYYRYNLSAKNNNKDLQKERDYEDKLLIIVEWLGDNYNKRMGIIFLEGY